MNGQALLLERTAASLRGVLTRGAVAKLVALLVGTWVLLTIALPQLHSSNTESGRWESPGAVIVLGLIIGMTYGLLSAGLVLVYRTSRIINFAHGQIGAFGSAVFGVAVVKWGIPYWIAFVPALLVAGAVGAASEATVVRRLRNAPPLMSVVATLGLGQFLVFFAFAFNSQAGSGAVYPEPVGLPSFQLGPLLVTPSYFGMLILSPILVLGIGVFLKFSWFGIGIRAAASNREAARMSAIFAGRMSSLAWGLAGALAAFSAILTQPTRGFSSGESFGPSLLLLALTGAVVGRMQSLPIAMAAGCALGVLEQLFLWNFAQTSMVQLVLFFVIVVALLAQRQRVGRAEEKGSWAAVQTARPLPEAIRAVRSVRLLGPAVLAVFVCVFAALPLWLNNANSVKVTVAFALVVIGLSVGIITGLGGQLSLGQFALGAVGAFVSFEVSRRTGSYFLSFLYGGLGAAAVSVAIGIPALRVRGLLLTVTTLSLALVMPGYLLQQSWMLGEGQNPGRPIVNGVALDSGRSYYYVGLATLLFALWLARNVRSGGLGRRLVAVRDNEEAARSFTVSAAGVKLQGFALAGFIAGVGGAMYGHSLSFINSSSFPTKLSIDVVVIAVIGGIGLLSGPFLGAALVQGATFIPLDAAGLAVTSLGQLLIILYLPGGIGSVVIPLRDRLAGYLARRSGVDVDAAFSAERGFDERDGRVDAAPPRHDDRRRQGVVPSRALLEARDLTKSFGGIRAVRGVTFDVRQGETLGLIGPNGAGKTTTFELLAGFTGIDSGSVRYGGRDITALGPEARGRLGLIRSFQDAALFPTLTVLECVELALERVQPTRFLPALLGVHARDRSRRHSAEELVRWMGLDRYRSSQIQELSTGTRRITEIACLVALQPELLLLDEPSSGVAQKETEALARLLVRLKDQLGLTLVIIEHDIPMIMRLSDRIICMAEGEVISSGTPEHVRNDPAVVEAYLGGSLTAIERSGAAPTAMPAQPLLLAGTVPGVGRARESALLHAFGSVDNIREAGVDELVTVPGIGRDLAIRIHETLEASSRE